MDFDKSICIAGGGLQSFEATADSKNITKTDSKRGDQVLNNQNVCNIAIQILFNCTNCRVITMFILLSLSSLLWQRGSVAI